MYCVDCVLALTACPEVALPFQVRIVTHHEERGKGNTGVHAALLAPNHVQLIPADKIPQEHADGTAVLYPCSEASLLPSLKADELQCLYIIDR